MLDILRSLHIWGVMLKKTWFALCIGWRQLAGFQNIWLDAVSKAEISTYIDAWIFLVPCQQLHKWLRFWNCLKKKMPKGKYLCQAQTLTGGLRWWWVTLATAKIVLWRRLKVTLLVVWYFSTVWPIAFGSSMSTLQFSTNYGNLLSHFKKCQHGYSLT